MNGKTRKKSSTKWQEFVLPEGPYSGKTMLQVYSRDTAYIYSLCGSGDKGIAEAAEAAIQHKHTVDPFSVDNFDE